MAKYKSLDEVPVIDLDEVLGMVNAVREHLGWEPLAELPKSEPGNPCRCVLGQSWRAQVLYHEDPAAADYAIGEPSREARELAELNGEVYFEGAETIVRAIGDVLGGRVEARDFLPEAVLPGDHPLMRWMIEFDAGRVPGLIEEVAV